MLPPGLSTWCYIARPMHWSGNTASQSNEICIAPFDPCLSATPGTICPAPQTVSPGWNRRHYFTDHLGTPRVTIAAFGDITDTVRLGPFGEPVDTPDCSQRAQFTGHERDSETGLDYMRARLFDQLVGRLLTIDPLRNTDVGKPQGWNAYAYVRNNPLRFTDPTGMYTAMCGNGVKNCDKQIRQFDDTLKDLLKDKNPGVRAAAAAYGKLGEENGVTLSLLRKVDKDTTGEVKAQDGTPGFTFDAGSKTFRPATQVSIRIDLGRELRNVALHEGSHIRDRSTFVGSMRIGGDEYDRSLNISLRESELRAYRLEGLGDRAIEKILQGSPYNDGRDLGARLFSLP